MHRRVGIIASTLGSAWVGIACSVGALAVGSVLTGCETKITDESFAKIRTGMALEEVNRAMGGAGTKQETGGVSISAAGVGAAAGSTQEVWIWKSPGREVSVTIDKGKVISFAKSGF
jgi:hypothetical protein